MNFCYFVTCFLVICDSCSGKPLQILCHVLKVIFFDCLLFHLTVPKKERGVWGFQGGDGGLEFSRRRKGQSFIIFPTLFCLSQYSYVSCLRTCFSVTRTFWLIFCSFKMHVVEMGLVRVYKALIRLVSVGTLHPPSDVYARSFLCLFFTLIKLCYTKALEWSSLAPNPEAKSSSEITNLTSFTISYHLGGLSGFFRTR